MLSRRAFLVGTGLVSLAACTSDDNGRVKPRGAKKIAYGKDPSQFGELTVPSDRKHDGVVVIVHGGFWQAQYGLDLGRPLAKDLVGHGWTTWNLEYRRVGNGGGWPNTLADVAAGIDHLAELDVDTRPVLVVGHSAGGQLAAWAAGRRKLPAGSPGADPKVTVTGVVSQAGVLDLATAARQGVGGGAPQQLAGGEPGDVPEHYRVADPIEQVPLSVPVLCVHSQGDQNVPYAQSTAYVAAARKAGAEAVLHETDGDHFTLIDPSTAAWSYVRDALPGLAKGRLPTP